MRTDTMYLVYVDSNGEKHYQPWQDVDTAGTLSEENGDDMELVGWATEADYFRRQPLHDTP